MANRGYLSWDTRILGLGFYIDGRRIKGGFLHPPASYSTAPSGISLPTLGHSDVVQHRWFGEDVPVNLAPETISFDMVLSSQADAETISDAHGRGTPVEIYTDIARADHWYIPVAAVGQILWKTSRKLPYALSFVNAVNRPPRVFIDGAEQTVVSASPPSSGEVYVPIVGGYSSIETPSGIVGTWLTLRYHPVIMARVVQADLDHRDPNDLNMKVAIEEVRSRLFQVAA